MLNLIWNKYGWSYLIFGSILILFFLWLFNFRKTGTSSVELFDIYDRFLPPSMMTGSYNYNQTGGNINQEYIPQSLLKNYNQKFDYNYSNSDYDKNSSTNTNNFSNANEFIYEDTASKGENKAREIIEKLTGKRFYKTRPSFLKNPITGAFLELDIFNPEVLGGLAIEYDGEQHDKYNKFLHKTKEAFRNQQYRDYIKSSLCKQNNIKLIRIPHDVKLNQIENYIKKEYSRLKLESH